MSFVAQFLVYFALLYGAWRLYRWAKGLKNANRMKWRRRCGFWFMWAPVLLWIGELLTPEQAEWALLPLKALALLKYAVDGVAQGLMQWGEGQVSGFYSAAIGPLAYALVYGAAGFLVGWPLDRMRKDKAVAEDEAAAKAKAKG